MIILNINRAKDILESHGVIDVHYGEEPIWIESIDEIKGVAHVRSLRNRESFNVEVSDLVE